MHHNKINHLCVVFSAFVEMKNHYLKINGQKASVTSHAKVMHTKSVVAFGEIQSTKQAIEVNGYFILHIHKLKLKKWFSLISQICFLQIMQMVGHNLWSNQTTNALYWVRLTSYFKKLNDYLKTDKKRNNIRELNIKT